MERLRQQPEERLVAHLQSECKERIMSKKIAMIGAGSVVFCKTLMSDILATPSLADSEFALMSPTEEKLRRMEAFGNRMVSSQ